jgi:DNA primase
VTDFVADFLEHRQQVGVQKVFLEQEFTRLTLAVFASDFHVFTWVCLLDERSSCRFLFLHPKRFEIFPHQAFIPLVAQISQETKEQILAATDIVDLIGSFLQLRRAGSRFVALCPFHNEKSPSFSIDPARQYFHCFGCGKSGDAITFVREYENLPFTDALKRLGSRVGITVEETTFDPAEDAARRKRARFLTIHREITEFMHQQLFGEQAAHAREYLKERGYNRQTAVNWQIGWMPTDPRVFLDWAREKKFTGRDLVDCGIIVQRDNGRGVYVRFLNRLMFPIRNDSGDVIAFSGRKLDPEQKGGKYVNSPETLIFKKSNVFFALEKARQAVLKEKSVIICEGQFDVIACHEHGLTHVVATSGTALTQQHAKLLSRYTKQAVLCFDSDDAGYNATVKAFTVLSAEGISVKVIQMPADEDPDSYLKKYGPEAMRNLSHEAREFFDVVIDRAAENGQLHGPEERSIFTRQLIPLLAAISDPVAKDGMLNHVATRLRTGANELRSEMSKAQAAASRKAVTPSRQTEDANIAPPVEAAPLDPLVGYLCSLALYSEPCQVWLGEQFETIHEPAEFLEGVSLLEKILSARPDANSHAAVNAFISSLPENQRMALHTDATFLGDLPGDPMSAVENAMAELSAKTLHRRDEKIKAELARPGLDPQEMVRLLHETKEIAELLKGVDQRFIFNERLAPSAKPRQTDSKRWPRRNFGGERNP